MAQVFNLSATLQNGTTTSATYTAKQTDNGIQGDVTIGPMANPTTTFALVVQLDRGDGNGWVNVGGLSGTGGLTGPKGGTPTDPVTCTGSTFCALQKGWLVRAQATVVNAPAGGIPATFVGNTF